MKSLILLTTLFVIFFTGCSPVKVIDNLSNESSKGYVEFYYMPGEGYSDFNYSVYAISGGEEFYEGHLPGVNLTPEKTSLFIAKSPDVYQFSVRVSTIENTFPVVIEEGMVTRVKILFKCLNQPPEKNVKLSEMPNYFKIEVSPERPVLFKGNFN